MEKSDFDLGAQAYREEDYAEAVKWYRMAAEQGNADAQYYLGVMYESGKGVEQNSLEAEKWYGKSAAQGHGLARFNLDTIKNQGNWKILTHDSPESVEFDREMAEQGNASFQCCLGDRYCHDNLGVKQDYAEAVKWYRMAAEQGYADAQTKLGFMYYNGFGVKQDYRESFRLFGLSNDAFGLGLSYLYGRGVGKDKAKAREYLVKAAKAGNANAMNYLNDDYTLKPVAKQDSTNVIGAIVGVFAGWLSGIFGGGSDD